jgi:hypothetical protein
MRAREFMFETKKAKKSKKQPKVDPHFQQSTRGLHHFANVNDKLYQLSRVSNAVAGADGTNSINIDRGYWGGIYDTAHPYTEVEAKMMKQAYKAAGVDYKDLNRGDMRSMELTDTHKVSPVSGFKGYGKKRSK